MVMLNGLKFVICTTWASKSCHLQRYVHSVRNGVSSRNGEVCAVSSRSEVCE